eukprot:TRINITY_DN1707_c0_g1::TRINITY_DN1707_c0_g1_i1::g.25094::m.25094 TRINITY_DN1707_c0_g1::TRINITY_DN1707_c0_g1_i1::g.25094  ORF type:complete len:105 (-),score=11.22,sp/Q550Q4/RHEB_DICDI/52.88/4e-31,Ras/PF00071.17/3.7e-22,Miro/PF08477.8/0.00021 TRINITY_DN1707_c0_g1_i1:35-349(-)
MLVYSITSRSSFEKIKIINDKLLTLLGNDKVPRVLVGNQTDLTYERVIKREEAQALADEWGCAFTECSAKLNEGVQESFEKLLGEVEKTMGHVEQPKDGKCIIL